MPETKTSDALYLLGPVAEGLAQVLAKMLDQPVESFYLEQSIWADLGGDSLDEVEIAMELEEKFSMIIDDDDIHNLLTVGAWLDYIEKNKKGSIAV